MYDYNNGRFLSVDPFIQAPTSTQSMNPYTYIFNNPLSGIDPTGYVSDVEDDAKFEGGQGFSLRDGVLTININSIAGVSGSNGIEKINKVIKGVDKFISNLRGKIAKDTLKNIQKDGEINGSLESWVLGELLSFRKHAVEYKRLTEISCKTGCDDVGTIPPGLVNHFQKIAETIAIVGTMGLGRVSGLTTRSGSVRLIGSSTPKIAPKTAKESINVVFRVQGGQVPNASKVRIKVDSNGIVSIVGDDMLFINIGQKERALEFLAKRGENASLVEFRVSSSFVEKLRNTAVDQRVGKANPGLPQKVDQTQTIDQFGIPSNMFDELLKNVEF